MSTAVKEKSSLSFKAEVLSNEHLNAEHLLLSLKPVTSDTPDTIEKKGSMTPGAEASSEKGSVTPSIKGPVAPLASPGQFYMLSVGPFPEPLLKRPLCYFRSGADGAIEFLYRIRGKGTRLLSLMKPGAVMDVLGPLGRKYPRPPKGTTPLIVAGGTGLASVFPLIQSMKGKAVVFYGSSCGEEILFRKDLEALSAELHLATDDGSCGLKGTVMDILGDYKLTSHHFVYTCGPEIMTSAVTKAALEAGATGCASLEAYMACGVGACMGCVIKTTKGYKRVCKEGPVFKLEELVFG